MFKSLVFVIAAIVGLTGCATTQQQQQQKRAIASVNKPYSYKLQPYKGSVKLRNCVAYSDLDGDMLCSAPSSEVRGGSREEMTLMMIRKRK